MEDGSNRTVYSYVNSGASFGGSSMEQEIGLGTGPAHRLHGGSFGLPLGFGRYSRDVPIDTRIEVHEGDSDYEVLEMRQIQLGGPVRN